MPESDISLIETVADSSKFGDKLELLINAMRRFEKAKSDADAAVKESEQRKTEADAYVNAKKNELDVKQREHDAAAAEALSRINLAKTHMAEALRIREENTAAEKRLAERERAIDDKERIVRDRESGLEVQQRMLSKAADLIGRQTAHINAMPKQ